ncbi:MAG: CDP-alcohol phosphatidyltransferase family protein [Candidatus Caldarchaeum sp.]|nr:CDP-alcohol phosphatidyltransferase family protein [Candidatus Caldarchaeum sp.]MCX8202148.1 CDP-alcohol phosphatidyltransferase family protein [Candidatus Caldarchaeum sp.]
MAVSKRGRKFFEKVVTPVVGSLVRANVSPNVLTVSGLLVTGVSLPFFSWGRADGVFFLLAGLLLALGSLLDGLDGLAARMMGKQTRFGAFLDSFTDRISDSFIVVGFVLSGVVDAVLAVAMLTAMMLVSYARARAESLAVDLKEVGLGERAVRLVAAVLGTFLAYVDASAILAAAFFITVVSAVTVVQRFAAVASALSETR